MKWLALILLLTGCTTIDPARTITRHCPIEYVDYDSPLLLKAIEQQKGYKGGKVYVTENCWHNAVVICKWALAQGIDCMVVGTGNHCYVLAGDKRIDYVYGVGLVARRR